jgi:hypothetical protein
MQALNFPRAYDFDLRESEAGTEVFDTQRRRHVLVTPEEWVRQHLVRYLVEDLGFPAGLVAVETGFTHRGTQHRADVICHDRQGKPLLMAECKAPEVKLRQNAFDQIARYNQSVEAYCLVVTNGLTHYCYVIDREQQNYRFLDRIPSYEEVASRDLQDEPERHDDEAQP